MLREEIAQVKAIAREIAQEEIEKALAKFRKKVVEVAAGPKVEATVAKAVKKADKKS